VFEAVQELPAGTAGTQPACANLHAGVVAPMQQQQLLLLPAPAANDLNIISSGPTAAAPAVAAPGTAATLCGPIVALDSAEISRELGHLLESRHDDSAGLLCLQESFSLNLPWGSHSTDSATAVDAALESFARSLSTTPTAQQAQGQQQQQGQQQEKPVGGASAGASAAVSTGSVAQQLLSSEGAGVLGVPEFMEGVEGTETNWYDDAMFDLLSDIVL
jgi:hypothetical protein